MKNLILAILILSIGCTNNQTTTQVPPPSPVPSVAGGTKPPDSQKQDDSNKDKDEKKENVKSPPDLEANTPSVSPAESVPITPPVIPPVMADTNKNTDKTTTEKPPDKTDGQKSLGKETPATDTGLLPPQNAGSPASSAAESTLNSAIDKNSGVTPIGSTLTYTSADEARIQYYKSFITGTISVDDFARLLFKDPDFNRAVQVVGDLYRQDKLTGSITPANEVKFQELAQKVGDAVLVYNQKKRSDHYSNLAGSVIIGTLLGATAGGFLMKEEWIPQVIKTKLGDRIPGYVRDSILGGVVGGTTVLLTMETYHVINDLSNPTRAYNADPILDVPSR